MTRYRLLIVSMLLLCAVCGAQWTRRIEDASIGRPDLLTRLNLPFRNWVTSDTAITSSDLALLQPDATVVRTYTAPNGQWAQLAVIAGHRKRSVHTPAFCMTGGGWETVAQQGCDLQVGGRHIPATRALMIQENHQVMMTYFFTDGDYTTRNLLQFQGVQILKRFGSKIPLGALVRIIVPIVSTAADADTLSNAFAAATVPGTLDALQSARLQLQ